MRAWQVTSYGRPSTALELVDVPVPEPGPGEVLVRTAATACNYNEVDGCHGRYLTVNPPLPYTLGMELTGEVVAAGPGATHWIGRRVVGCSVGATGAHAEYALGMADMTFDVPDALSAVDAAAFFIPFHLAHLGLHERAKVQPGETVLVHAAAGGVGSAAVQLAVAAGARVIATAGGADKCKVAADLGAHVTIDNRAGDLTAAVLEHTDGRGVDLCFDGVGGDVMLQSLKCLARNGRHLIVGFASGIEAEEVPMVTGRMFCFGNIAVMGVILSYHDSTAAFAGSGYNPTPREVGERVHAELGRLLAAGSIRPVIGATMPFESLPQALELMEDRATTGRVILTVNGGA